MRDAPPRAGAGLALAVALGLVLSATPDARLGAQGARPERLNQVIEQLEQGKPALANQHWQFIDMEHSPYAVDRLATMVAGLKPEGATRPRLTPVVRIPYEGKDAVDVAIKQVLDVGVLGVIVPHVDTREQAQRAVRAMRYPPQRGTKLPEPAGIRGWGPFGAAKYWGLGLPDYARRADVWPLNPEGELLLLVMVESPEAVARIDEILSVPGVGGVLIGPSDLSMTMGVGTPAANPKAPEVETATAVVARACVARTMACGTFESPDREARIAQGFRLFPTGAAAPYGRP